MKILLVHNFYQQPGGEDQVFAAEAELLRGAGHEVVTFTADNDAVEGMGRLRLAGSTVWNRRTFKDLSRLVRRERPAVAHFHNTFPLISPAAYYAARAGGAAVVQTLHNYRLLCPNAIFYRKGRPCEDCLGKPVAWPGVVHACYRGSRPVSAVTAVATAVHRAAGTWDHAVDRYVALTRFARDKFVRGGVPPEKLTIKPNFVSPDPGPGDGGGGHAVFVGRLTPEKGIATLLEAWKRLGEVVPLTIIGGGPMEADVRAAAAQIRGVEWLGPKPPAEVYEIIGRSVFLVFPSVWYETFGRVAIEAFAKGTPVLASDLGAMAELVDHGRTGMLFRPGDAGDLVDQARRLLSDGARLQAMRLEARSEFERHYTAERNYAMLREVYESALAGRPASAGAARRSRWASRPRGDQQPRREPEPSDAAAPAGMPPTELDFPAAPVLAGTRAAAVPST